MTDENKLARQRDRGTKAKQVLENDLVQEAFEKMETKILQSITGSAGDEQEIRERAYLMYRLLQNFKSEFSRILHTGEAARKELLTIRDKSKVRRMISNG